jgi:hypothetical protein
LEPLDNFYQPTIVEVNFSLNLFSTSFLCYFLSTNCRQNFSIVFGLRRSSPDDFQDSKSVSARLTILQLKETGDAALEIWKFFCFPAISLKPFLSPRISRSVETTSKEDPFQDCMLTQVLNS